MKKLLLILLCASCFAVSPTINSYTGGQATPHMEPRVDFPGYQTLNRTMENMFATVQGPVSRRPGTYYVATASSIGEVPPRPDPDPTKIGISTMAELALIGVDAGYPLNGDYELRADLDATGITFWPIGLHPVTLTRTPFTGTFDGNYYEISNMTIGDGVVGEGVGNLEVEAAGLFNQCNGATIENLTISNMSLVGDNVTEFSGGLLAVASISNSTVTNCHVQGSITTTQELVTAGGMFGQTNSDLSICSSNVIISSAGVGTNRIGGFTGFTAAGSISNCYAQGSITITGAGEMFTVGGFTGQLAGTDQQVTNCYTAVTISGAVHTNDDVGGFSGVGGGGTPVYTSNYWDGDLIATPPSPLDDIGDDGDVAGITKSGTSAMQTQDTFSGWDFTDVWWIDNGSDYPIFQWQLYNEQLKDPLFGNGTVRLIPFEISTDDAYIVEAGTGYFRFYKDDGS